MLLNTLRYSNPVEVAEFVVVRVVSDEPAFSWWVTFTLKNRGIIIACVNLRVSKKTHKLSIEVTMSIDHAKLLDSNNVDMLWHDSNAK